MPITSHANPYPYRLVHATILTDWPDTKESLSLSYSILSEGVLGRRRTLDPLVLIASQYKLSVRFAIRCGESSGNHSEQLAGSCSHLFSNILAHV